MPKKQVIAPNDAPPKVKTNTIVGGTISPRTVNSEHATEDTGSFLSKRTANSAQSLPLYEGQILQMLADMKEQMKKQTESDHDLKQATLDCENSNCEQEALKQLNEQLQAQITALQRT